MSAITASRRKDLSDGFYLYKNIYLIGLRSKAWDDGKDKMDRSHWQPLEDIIKNHRLRT